MDIYNSLCGVVNFNYSYEYNADGMRLSKTVGSTTTKYYYVGSQLVEMTQGSDKLHFTNNALRAAKNLTQSVVHPTVRKASEKALREFAEYVVKTTTNEFIASMIYGAIGYGASAYAGIIYESCSN